MVSSGISLLTNHEAGSGRFTSSLTKDQQLNRGGPTGNPTGMRWYSPKISGDRTAT